MLAASAYAIDSPFLCSCLQWSGKVGIDEGWRLVVRMDANHWSDTSGCCAVGAVAVVEGVSTVSMVVGTGVVRLVFRR